MRGRKEGKEGGLWACDQRRGVKEARRRRRIISLGFAPQIEEEEEACNIIRRSG